MFCYIGSSRSPGAMGGPDKGKGGKGKGYPVGVYRNSTFVPTPEQQLQFPDKPPKEEKEKARTQEQNEAAAKMEKLKQLMLQKKELEKGGQDEEKKSTPLKPAKSSQQAAIERLKNKQKVANDMSRSDKKASSKAQSPRSSDAGGAPLGAPPRAASDGKLAGNFAEAEAPQAPIGVAM